VEVCNFFPISNGDCLQFWTDLYFKKYGETEPQQLNKGMVERAEKIGDDTTEIH
jgi:hypothetical protein